MSDDIDASELQALTTELLITTAASALYFYEYLVTLDQEINHIWAKKWSLTTLIFAFNRYAALAVAFWGISATPSYAASTGPSCVQSLRVFDTLILLQYLITALFSALRVYAIANRSILLFAAVFALNMVPFGTNMFVEVKGSIVYDVVPLFGSDCEQLLPDVSDATLLRLSLSTRIAVIVADLLLLAVTWYKAAGTVREAYRLGIRVPLWEILLRDGTLFFLGVLGINVLNVLTTNVPSLAPVDLGSTFIQMLPPILISRFMLNLRQVNGDSGTLRTNGHDTAHRSTIRFNTGVIVGNMGESLDFGTHSHDDGLEDEEGMDMANPLSDLRVSSDAQSIRNY